MNNKTKNVINWGDVRFIVGFAVVVIIALVIGISDGQTLGKLALFGAGGVMLGAAIPLALCAYFVSKRK